MNRIRIIGSLILVSLLLPSLSWAGFSWQKNLETALEKGKKEQKPVFAYFYHPVDNREDKEVWQSPSLSIYYSKFISAAVNIVIYPDLAGKYNTNRYPTLLFFDPQGREIYSMRLDDNRLKRIQVLNRMKSVLNSIDQFALVENQLEYTRKNSKLLLTYAKGLRDRAKFDKADQEFNRLLKMNISPEFKETVQEEYTRMIFLKATKAFYEGKYQMCIETLNRYIDKNSNSESIYHAKFVLGIALCESGNDSEGKRALQSLSNNSKAGIFQSKAKNYLKSGRK